MVHVLKTILGEPPRTFKSRLASSSKNGLWDTIIKSPPKDDIEAIVRAISAGLSTGVMLETFRSGARRANDFFAASAVCAALAYGLCQIWTTFLKVSASKSEQSDFICALPRSESRLSSSGQVSAAFAWRIRNSFMAVSDGF